MELFKTNFKKIFRPGKITQILGNVRFKTSIAFAFEGLNSSFGEQPKHLFVTNNRPIKQEVS